MVEELWLSGQDADGFSENLPSLRVPSSAFRPSTPLNESNSVSSVINSDDCLTIPSTATSKNGSTNLDETLDPILLRVSSPLRLCSNQPPAPPVSSITESVKTYVHIKGNENFSPKLFEGSDVNLTDATALAEIFCSRFHLSDECSSSLFSLISNILPPENVSPSGYSHEVKMKKNFNDNIRSLETGENFSICILRYRFQLRDIVRRNLNQIFNYSEYRKRNPHNDLNFSIAPPVKVSPAHRIDINLNLFTDGVNIKKSTLKKEIWPIWLQVTDLPPILRMAKKNTVLAGLIVGSGLPDWELITPNLRGELITPIELFANENLSLSVAFNVNLLVADLGAKSHLLNMFKFNGFYGCHYCTAKGKTIEKTNSYYPFSQTGEVREPVLNNIFVEIA